MKKLSFFLLFFTLFMSTLCAQDLCNGSGEVIVFANYDGGVITINVDVDIPDLKIGICTYEAATVIITGTFASNVSEVHYAGYNSYNDHCSVIIPATTISVPVGTATDIQFAPPANTSDPNGYGSIICAYSCGTGNQGGCNTSAQVAAYFTDYFNANLLYYLTQYGCWSGTYNVSDYGNCCPEGTEPLLDAQFSVSDNIICAGECVDFTDLSEPMPDSWSWSFPGALVSSSSSQNPSGICYAAPGSFQASLTIFDGTASDASTQTITVENCPVSGCTYSEATNYNALAGVDDGSCVFPPCNGTCPGDFNFDGIVSVADLLQFIAIYGTTCPQ